MGKNHKKSQNLQKNEENLVENDQKSSFDLKNIKMS